MARDVPRNGPIVRCGATSAVPDGFFRDESAEFFQDKEAQMNLAARCSSPELTCTGEFAVNSMDEVFSGSGDSEISPQGCGHSQSLPVRSNSYCQLPNHREQVLPRSKTQKAESPQFNLRLDSLSEHEKKRIIERLVRVRNDGKVEVDVTPPHVASALLQLDAVDSSAVKVKGTLHNYKPVPKLKIAMLVVGTRGDVQPFLAFARRLQEFGHHVRLATHVNFRSFVKSAGVDFYPLAGDPRIMAEYMAKTKGFVLSGPSEISVQRKQLKEIINSLLPACTEPDLDTGLPFRAQAIIANPPAYGHVHVAEALGVPIHIFFTFPWTPTSHFPHPMARVPQSAAYRLSYLVVDLIIWWGIRGYINEFRKRKLKLAPIDFFSTYHGSISHLPTGYMWSPQLVPKPTDWGPLVDVVGYCFLNLGTKFEPPDELVRWIEHGTAPIYIGFGSIPLDDEKKITAIILDALRETGQRGIISRGWGDLGRLSEVPVDVHLLDDCPHDWLFPRCAAVIHHGGAGTAAASLRAGCPTMVVPFFGDQFFWGEKIHYKGVGPVPIPIAELTADRLADAIRSMLDPEVKQRAVELAKLIEEEDGATAAVEAFHRHLPSELPLLPTTTSDEPPSALTWLSLLLEKCCRPF